MKLMRHLDQSDAAPVASWEKQVFMQFRWPRNYLPDLYILNSQLFLSFLSKLDMDDGLPMYFDASKINLRVSEFEHLLQYDGKPIL